MAHNEAGQDYPYEPKDWLDHLSHWWFMLWEWLMRSLVPVLILAIPTYVAIYMMVIGPKMALLGAVPIAIALFLAQLFSHRKIWEWSIQLKLDHPAVTPAGMTGFFAFLFAIPFHWHLAGIIGGACLGYIGGLMLGLIGGYVNEECQDTTSY